MALYDSKLRPTAFGMTEEERNKKAGQVPGSVSVTPAAPTAIARPLATQAGEFMRVGGAAVVNKAIGATESIANAAQYPNRMARGVVRDVAAGFAGAQNPNAGQLGGSAVQLPRVSAAPAAAPSSVPSVARPGVRFAGIDAAPDNFYRNPPGTKPRTAAELNQASQAEVAARTSTQSPASPPTGAGAPSAAGGAAPKPYTLRPDGVAVVKVSNGSNAYGATGASVANAQGRIGSVNTQNFGNPVVPQGPGAIARPGVASTFGLGVNDPRLNDQRVESVNIQRPGNLTFNPAGNAETFNARQDREGRQATNSAIDLALFQARGKPGAEAAISDLLQTQARLNSGAEGLSQEAIQNRANRDNAYGIADLNNAGENNRAGIQADVARGNQQVTREGQQLDYGAKLADIARPQLKQDANGNYINIAGNTSTTVTDAQGNPVRGAQTEQAQQRDYGQENDNKMFTDLLATKIDQSGNPLPNAVDLAMADMQKYKAAQNQQTAQSASTAPTLDAYVKAARAAGYKQSDAELAAAFQKKYPQAK